MYRALRPIALAYIVVTAGCTAAATHNLPDGAVPDVVPLASASADMADTLSVSVQGPAAVREASVVRFTANVANGSARRYYYWWFAAACARSAGCTPTSYVAIAEGEGRSEVNLTFGAEHAEKDLVVQVAEIDGRGRTGSSPEYPVEGPARRAVGGGGGSSEIAARGICDWFAGSFYPHTGTFRDSISGRRWERSFRRDYCGNRISWNPQS